MDILRLAAVATVLFAGAAAPAGSGDFDVDAALVLAVDVSRSVTVAEAAIQRDGYAAAFESAEVLKAIERGFRGRIAVSFVEWSSPDHQSVVTDWTIVDGPEAAAALAATLRASSPILGGTTSISSALAFSERMLHRLPYEAERRIIDISGDGQHNFGAGMQEVRARILADGIVINGLPIRPHAEPRFDIADYYRRHVIGGPGAFLVSASGMDDFANAVRTKIAFEVAGLTPPEQGAPRHFAQLDAR